ncbi:MAG: LmbE family protein [Planctomycetes bacterium SM23_32]|nr:MAG: LmbE family protein [Planctomycetes bacterium SM23_32]
MGEHRTVALAIAAHPDDIEFMMGGTMMLLKESGCETHYMTIANGSCGSATLPRGKIVRIRAREARQGAEALGAVYHPSYVDDIEIRYDRELLARVAAVVRDVDPGVLLVPSLEDYMEDHVNACRLAVSAAFCRGMRNFPTCPPVEPVDTELTAYHALPYGLRDALGRRVFAGHYVDVSTVMERKRAALAMHRSQKEWLGYSQGLDAYVSRMEEMTCEVGRMSGRFEAAEGWRRHNHLGFCAPGSDPLADALGEKVFVDEDYARDLEGPPWPHQSS